MVQCIEKQNNMNKDRIMVIWKGENQTDQLLLENIRKFFIPPI